MTTALFDVDGEEYVPSGFARGPWDAGLLHGGPVGALLAERLQSVIDPAYQPVRLTVDLLRPVPMKTLRCDVELVRSGNRLAAAHARLICADKVVAAGSLVVLRPQHLAQPDNDPVPPPDTPEEAQDLWDLARNREEFIGGGLTFRFITTDEGTSGGVMWLHLHRPVLPDAAPSPLARVAAAADVPSAVSSFDGRRYDDVGFINADISFHLHRLPQGEWIRVTSTSRWESTGIGTVSATIGDRSGPVGRIGQALVLTPGMRPASRPDQGREVSDPR